MVIYNPLYCSNMNKIGKKKKKEQGRENPVDMCVFDLFTSLLAREVDGAVNG